MPIDWIGTIAGFCTTASFAPQVFKILKTRRVADISLWMYSIFVTGIVLWLVYGALIQSTPLIIANAMTLVLAGTVLVMKIIWRNRPLSADRGAGSTKSA